MELGILPTIASFIFVVVLSLIYFHKKRSNHILNRIYKLFIFDVIAFAVVQILYVISLKYIKSNIFALIFWKLYWTFGISCWGFTTIMFIIIIKKINVNTFKDLVSYSKKLKYLCFFFLFVAIVTLIVSPYTDDVSNLVTISYNSDFLKYVEIVYCSSIMIFQFVFLLINRKNVDKKCKLAVYLALIIGIVFLVLQEFFYEASFFVPCACIFTYILFYTHTNPDIELVNEIYLAQNDIEKSSKTKTDFLSNMTFEIKNPLSFISNTCDSLIHQEEFNSEEAIKEIKQIINSSNTLMDIVNNIVNISKIESSDVMLIEKNYELKTLLNELQDVAINKIGSKKVQYIVQLDENISSVLYGDSQKLSQSLTNIVLNAINYTDVGKVTLSVTSKKSSEFETLTFKVSDTGCGIKEEDKSKIFLKGTRLDNAIEKEIEGSGLGLSIAKDHIDSMNGKIWFDSEYNVGSTFFIEITQKIIDSTPIKNATINESNEKVDVDCSNYKVLLVDDNKPNLKVIKRLLEKYKFQVDAVSSGQECIYKIKNEEKFDIIFLDHFMPEMDGIETIRVLKSLDGYVLPPIICVTANSIPGMKELYMKEGFDDFIPKPIKVKDLDKVVKKYFLK